MVNDLRYPPSNQTVCQQMSLPLTYDDGINLLPKHCDQDEAYYACDIPCKLLVRFIKTKFPYYTFISKVSFAIFKSIKLSVVRCHQSNVLLPTTEVLLCFCF